MLQGCYGSNFINLAYREGGNVRTVYFYLFGDIHPGTVFRFYVLRSEKFSLFSFLMLIVDLSSLKNILDT